MRSSFKSSKTLLRIVHVLIFIFMIEVTWMVACFVYDFFIKPALPHTTADYFILINILDLYTISLLSGAFLLWLAVTDEEVLADG